MQHYDVVIIGGGMVGLALAASMANKIEISSQSGQSLRIAIISSHPISKVLPTEPELRVSAINEANRQIFQSLGVWDNIDVCRRCDYEKMHVWDKDSFGNITFSASEVGANQLGCIVENQSLINALYDKVEGNANLTCIENVTIQTLSLGESQHAIVLENGMLLSTKLVVGADGANSLVRRTANFPLNFGEYGQTALVATIRSSQTHQNTARQVFTEYGPLALLPLSDPNLCSIVWSQDSAQTHKAMSLSETEFNKLLTVVSNHSLGVLSLESERKSFELKRQYARQWVADGFVLCGDSAHTFHPLAGQGANLGFEDAWSLADTLHALHVNKQELFNAHHFRQYERARKTAALKMIATMESFHQGFTGNNNFKKFMRGVALRVADKFTPLNIALVKEALGIQA